MMEDFMKAFRELREVQAQARTNPALVVPKGTVILDDLVDDGKSTVRRAIMPDAMAIGDIEVIQTPLLPAVVPKIELDPDVCVSPGFRCEFNEWLLETFGTKPNTEVFMFDRDTLLKEFSRNMFGTWI